MRMADMSGLRKAALPRSTARVTGDNLRWLVSKISFLTQQSGAFCQTERDVSVPIVEIL